MARRIDIELTSSRDDGTWTWRAAGARQPKGVLPASLLYSGAKIGDVVRAEAEFEIEGITVIAVFPPKEKRAEPERLEVLGTAGGEFQGVTSSLVPKRERRRDDDRRGPRPPGDRPFGERSARPDRAQRGPRPEGGRGEGRPESRAGGRAGGDEGGPKGGRPERGDRRVRPDRGAGDRGPRPDRGAPGRERGPRSERPGEDRARRERPAAHREERPAPPKPKRLSPGNKHRQTVLDALTPEHRPIAEQVLRGGIPAVRQAIEQQNAQARAEGLPEVKPGPLLAIAEDLLPRLKVADWRDRADAAVASVDEIGLRDLRSVVAGADAGARDDESRLLASTLREALERRLGEQRDAWVRDVGAALDEHRLVRALRLSSRPPDPTTRIPSELAVRLSDAAGEAMAPDTPPDRWTALLDAVADSPVRRSVKAVGLPTEAGDALLQLAKQLSGRVPSIAALLGIDMPPPPGPPRPGRASSRPPGAPGRPRPAPPANHREAPQPPAPPSPPEAGDPASPTIADAEPPSE